MTADLEVYFCDLCNESVPLADLEAGKAKRVRDRVVGACCAATLSPGAGEPARVVADRVPARTGGVFLGVLLLAGLAAAATFLDWRIAEEARIGREDVARVEASLGEATRRLSALEDALTRTAGRSELAQLTPRLGSIEEAIAEVRRAQDGQARLSDGLGASLTEMGRAALSRERESLAALNEIRAALDAAKGDLAALRAEPRAKPPVVEDAVAPPPPRATPAPALPPELEHSVAALGDEDPGTRFAAVDKLLRSRDLRVLKALVAMAKDSNTFVRRLTVEGLRDFKHVDAVDALLVALADPESVVRHTAFTSLRLLTSQRFEFDPDGNASTRSAGQRRWQEWWDKNREGFAF